MVTQAFPRQPVPMPDHPSGEETLPNVQSKPPLVKSISSHPITCSLGAEPNPHLAEPSCKGFVKNNEVPLSLFFSRLNNSISIS